MSIQLKAKPGFHDDLKDLRQTIGEFKYRSEECLVRDLLKLQGLEYGKREEIENTATELVCAVREKRIEQPLLDAFLQEFGLSNEEGIALMCLAEALLRVPDGKTADALIADKIMAGDWSEHLGQADSSFVNASTWGLMLTGKVISLDQSLTKNPAKWFGNLVNRLGEPVIRKAMYSAMQIMGSEFVLGRSIEEAVRRGRKQYGKDAIFSFDMLGEGARDAASAQRYFEAYAAAITEIARKNLSGGVLDVSGVSVKLSALHPRYEFSQKERVRSELGSRLLILAKLAANSNVTLTIDAEEMDRLEISLSLFEDLARNTELQEWLGLGIVVQAYGKRSLPTIRWIAELARQTGRKFHIRLVKGAYWDTEIKHAQEFGLQDFTVFTRKASTDLSYLVCAQELLRNREYIYSQFATHNAHTLATIMEIAGERGGFEFQRLHGMGELLYGVARAHYPNFPQVRVYAPVGSHKDLLAYLVRRLLENGANSSFVNRFMNADIPAREVVRDPVQAIQDCEIIRHPKIKLPAALFRFFRKNSDGVDLTSDMEVDELNSQMSPFMSRKFSAGPNGFHFDSTIDAELVSNPAIKEDIVGHVVNARSADIERALTDGSQHQPQWDALGGTERGHILARAADLFEHHRAEFMSLLVREAGKTYPDAIAEFREAVDFCRYYGGLAKRHFDEPEVMPGPTGETNELSLHGRGVFACISPWNFPLAIFLGQVTAALAAGNSVIAKPAEQTPLIAFRAVQLLHEAGVPEKVLHFIPGDGHAGAKLVNHELVAGVAFTGGTMTAQKINRALADRKGPIVPLIAETGGQNVMFVDSTAVLEQVCDDVVQSAFISAGQRCSSLRVLYLQEEIAGAAIKMICGAMDELCIGDPSRLRTDIGPIISEGAALGLQFHIETMSRSAWFMHSATMTKECANGSFVAPHLFEIDSIEQLKSEQFGPILHVIRFAACDFETCIREAQATGYGLTLGLHSRIEGRAQELFSQSPVGNMYVNRNMVGAVVGVQPFGGQGLSGTGPKAGGPRYLFRFATEKTLTVNTMASGGNTELLRL